MENDWASKVNERTQRAISRYSVSLMNNTKWREILIVLYQQKAGFPIEVAFVRDEEEFRQTGVPPINLLEDDFIQDGGFGGGPCDYRDIFAIRIKRKENYRNPKTGAVSISEEASNELLKALNKLGKLPIELTDEHIIIHGYKK